MIASDFPESNLVLHAPSGMTAEECTPLNVFRGADANGQGVVISCWKITREELAEVARTGRIWLGIIGQTMPPVYMSGTNPFKGVISDEGSVKPSDPGGSS